MRLRGLLPLAFLLLPLAARAQVSERITVEVVDVPVYVFRDGVPVKGLRRDDFELFVNGRKQAFEYFDVIDDAVQPAADGDEVAPVPIRERRLFLLVFDLAFSYPAAVSRAQAAALDLVDRSGDGDFFSVATFSAKRGLDYVVPFTYDRDQVRYAIQGLGFSPARDPLGLVVSPPPAFMLKTEPELPAEVYYMENAASSVATGDVQRNFVLDRMKRNIEHQITELASIGERLAPLKGTKHVIVLTPGFYGNAVTDMARGRRGPRAPAADPRILEQLQSMYRRYQTVGLFLHTVDTAGLRIESDPLATQSLHLLASGTGGQVVTKRNDLGAALAELVATQRSGYLLGFRPPATRSGYNKILVKLKDPKGADIRFRRGFSTDSVPVDVANGIYLADIILHDVPQTGLNARIDALGGSLVIRVPLQAMAVQLGNGGKADVMLYITDPHNTVVDFHTRQIDVPAAGQAPKQGMLTLNIDLPKGDYIAKAILRVGDSIGYSRLPFTH